MQVRNKNMIDFAAPDFVCIHLHLCALPAIDQKSMIKGLDYLGRWMPVMCGHRRIIPQNCYRKHELYLGILDIKSTKLFIP